MMKSFTISFFFFFFLMAFNSNVSVSCTFNARDLGKLAADLELGIVLAQHLRDEKANFTPRLTALIDSMKAVEDAFYDEQVMIQYCPDAHTNSAFEIMLTAFRKDLVNPFAENFNLKWLPLDEYNLGSTSSITVSELRETGKLKDVIERIKCGRLHFKFEYVHGYKNYLKTQVRRFVTEKAMDLLLKAFEAEYQRTLSFKAISYRFGVKLTEKKEHLGSFLTMEMVRRIFIYLPFLRFIPL